MADALIEEFRSANAVLSNLVLGELSDFFGMLDLSKPEAARDALLSFVPLLVDRYGSVAESLAIDFYDQQRAASGALGTFQATAPPLPPIAPSVDGSVKYLAGNLWTPTPEAMLSGLALLVDKFVKQPGRDVVPYNARREGVGWARVPTGSKTCAFCLMLASRDAVYISKRTASRGADGNSYHGNCDCQAVRIGNGDSYPKGYLPDDYYEIYTTSVDEAASRDTKDILASMRRLYPNQISDGVHSH